uniref:Uncharacterized protein n=1 Tax=Panagrolaimus superbus TaxID=310955 RepID=A0A914YQ77_9BILA
MASSSSYIIDETTREAFFDTMEIDEYSTSTTTTKNFEELLYDSGISSDSLSSSDSSFSSCCSENLYVTTTTTVGPTNFGEICSKKSPELPAEYSQDLDEDEKCATDSLNSSWDFNELFRAEPCGRRSPLLDLSNSSTQ